MAARKFWSLLDDAAKKALKVTKDNAPARVKKSGQYIGAPAGVNTPGKLAELRAKYYLSVKEGTDGADWYHHASDALNRASDDPELAARTFGRTSQGAAVDQNAGWGIKAYNQANLGVDINAGRFPGGVKKDLDDWLSEASEFGPKLEPFTENLRVGWDPSVGDRPVHDIWDGRAWGYKNKNGKPWDQGFSETQHKFMDSQAEVITQAANSGQLGGRADWDHLRTQAAAWTGEKIRHGDIKPEDAAQSYGEFMGKYETLLTRETVPGSNTGHLQGMLTDPALKGEYDEGVRSILYGDTGQDPISRAYGMLNPGESRGVGVYEGDVSPATAVRVLSGRASTPVDVGGKARQMQMVDPASRELLDATESTYGMLTGQKAFAWNQPVYQNVTKSMANMADIDVGRPLTADEMIDITERVSKMFPDGSVAPTLTPKGVRLLNFGDNKGFSKKVESLIDETPLEGAGRFGMIDSNYVENPWDTPGGQYGQGYLENIDRPERPNLQAGFDRVAPGLAEGLNDFDRGFAARHGLDTSEHLLKMREAISKDGLKGLRKLIETGVVPAFLIAGMFPGQSEAQIVEQFNTYEKKAGLGAGDYAAAVGHGAASMGKMLGGEFLRMGGFMNSLIGAEDPEKVEGNVDRFAAFLDKNTPTILNPDEKTKKAQANILQGLGEGVNEIRAGREGQMIEKAFKALAPHYKKLPKSVRGILESY